MENPGLKVSYIEAEVQCHEKSEEAVGKVIAVEISGYWSCQCETPRFN